MTNQSEDEFHAWVRENFSSRAANAIIYFPCYSEADIHRFWRSGDLARSPNFGDKSKAEVERFCSGLPRDAEDVVDPVTACRNEVLSKVREILRGAEATVSLRPGQQFDALWAARELAHSGAWFEEKARELEDLLRAENGEENGR